MTFPSVTFIENDKSVLASYICYLAKSIQLGKYPKGNYVVLPNLIRKNPLSVHFPKFPYSHRFWKLIAHQDHYGVSGPFPILAMREVLSFLTEYQASTTDRQMDLWYQKERLFTRTILNVLDPTSLFKHIRSIRILITEFGTLGSFSVIPQPAGKCSLVCTWRTDADLTDLFRTLLQVFILTRQGSGPRMDVGGIGWYERVAILQYLLTQTKLMHIVSPISRAKQSERLIQESNRYLASLGFPVENQLPPIFEYGLTNQERAAWTYLMTRKNSIVSFDDVADAIWRSDAEEKFSLYALAKLIENLRRKVRDSGINREMIFTFRKQGYMVVA